MYEIMDWLEDFEGFVKEFDKFNVIEFVVKFGVKDCI